MEELMDIYFASYKDGEFLSKLEIVDKETSIDQEVEKQLKEYFSKRRKVFNLPLKIKGSDFQVRVWKEISKIPYGETRTYSQIGQSLGNRKLARAVGTACGKNPLPIIVPCHRVLGENKNFGGYKYGINMKKKLLDLEGVEYDR